MQSRNFRAEFKLLRAFFATLRQIQHCLVSCSRLRCCMNNISTRQWGIAIAACLICAFFSAGFTSAVLSKGFGSSDAAAWVQAIGVTAGIGIAIWAPAQQRRAQVRDEKIRAYHHALALVNDLRSRITYVRNMLTEGGRPLAALNTTASTLFKRYESLYDRELYTHLPGPIVDRIVGMAGSVTGVETAVTYVSSVLKNEPSAMLPASDAWVTDGDPFEKLYQDFDELFTALEAEANKARS